MVNPKKKLKKKSSYHNSSISDLCIDEANRKKEKNEPINTMMVLPEKLLAILHIQCGWSMVMWGFADNDFLITASGFYWSSAWTDTVCVNSVSVDLPGQNTQLNMFSRISSQFSSYKLQNLNNLQNWRIIIEKVLYWEFGTYGDQIAHTIFYSWI